MAGDLLVQHESQRQGNASVASQMPMIRRRRPQHPPPAVVERLPDAHTKKAHVSSRSCSHTIHVSDQVSAASTACGREVQLLLV